MTSSPNNSSFPRSSLRSSDPVRNLTASQLGLTSDAREGVIALDIEDDDPILLDTQRLLADGYAGVIFTGPPGTSKSWYASQIAMKLVNLDPERVRFIQFHPSYQYEDFVEGYVPSHKGGFTLKPKHLLEMCKTATKYAGQLCVIVIDELSRTDPGRVFGEALTYIEMTKRGQKFRLASGREVSIPSNLIFLATMNPFDRGVDEVDMALERRFAKIAMEPDVAILRQFLSDSSLDQQMQGKVVRFFDVLRRHPNQYARIGHAYFYNVKDIQGLKRLWNYQLRFMLEKAFRLDQEELQRIQALWERIIPREVETNVTTASDAVTATTASTQSSDEATNIDIVPSNTDASRMEES